MVLRPFPRLGQPPSEQSLSLDLEDANAPAEEAPTRKLSHSHSDMGLRQEPLPAPRAQDQRPYSQIFDLDISGES
jgi:hypothetical protein